MVSHSLQALLLLHEQGRPYLGYKETRLGLAAKRHTPSWACKLAPGQDLAAPAFLACIVSFNPQDPPSLQFSSLSSSVSQLFSSGCAGYLGRQDASALLRPCPSLDLWRTVNPSPSHQAADCADSCSLQLRYFLSLSPPPELRVASFSLLFSTTLLLISCLCVQFVTTHPRLPHNQGGDRYAFIFSSDSDVLNSPTDNLVYFLFKDSRRYIKE